MSPPQLHVVIAGAGIAGLTSALALRRNGHSVTILERSSLSHEIGQGITFSPNGGRVLKWLGVDFEKAKMAELTGVAIIGAETLNELHRVSYASMEDRFGVAMQTAYRIDIHAELVRMVTTRGREGEGKVVIRTRAGVKRWDADKGQAVLESGEIVKGDVLVAADGVHSSAAQEVVGRDDPLEVESSGVVVYRFTVPTATIEADPDISHLLDPGDGWCTFRVPNDKTPWLVQYYCRNNEICNFALYSSQSPAVAAAKAQELKYEVDKGALLREMEGFHPRLLKVASLANDVLPLWRCTTRKPLKRLYRGKLVVVGDAAHPVLPHAGQGAVSAIEDAAILGVLLSDLHEHHNLEDVVQEILELFSKMRVPRLAVYKSISDVPFFKQGADSRTEEENSWFGDVGLPATATGDQEKQWYMEYDAVADAQRVLKEHNEEMNSRR